MSHRTVYTCDNCKKECEEGQAVRIIVVYSTPGKATQETHLELCLDCKRKLKESLDEFIPVEAGLVRTAERP